MQAHFIKMWNKELNYIGKAYDILGDKIRAFYNTCWSIGIKETQFHAVFPLILKENALEFYLDRLGPDMTFAETYRGLRSHFDIRVNRE